MTATRHFDASLAECLVFTYKDGLLARVAHDLKIRVTEFEVEADERPLAIHACFSAASLRVVCAVEKGADKVAVLDAGDKRQIDQAILREVLDAKAFPDITFSSSSVQQRGDTYLMKGTLTLHGTRRPVTVRVHRSATWWIGETRIHQPDFGIKPYRAMLGTLRVKPDVMVHIALPADPWRHDSPTRVASRNFRA